MKKTSLISLLLTLVFIGLNSCAYIPSPSLKIPIPDTSKPPQTPPSDSGDDGNSSAGSNQIALYRKYTHRNFRNAPEFKRKVTVSSINYRVLNAAIYYMTNEYRAKKGKKPLPYHERLEVAAFFHSKKMVEQNFFDHTNTKDRRRRSTADRAKLAGIANPYIAENIVYTYTQSQQPTYLEIAWEMMDSWINSKGHRQNMLSDQAIAVGCGGYANKTHWYGTQVFQWYKEVQNSSTPPVDKF